MIKEVAMESNVFKKRAYGFVVVKAINSNYNADFTGQPRTLPDGTVYATDKALKYMVRHYIKNEYSDQKVFIYKRFNENQNPYTLKESYEAFFDKKITKNQTKKEIIRDLLSAIDVRFFGVTFAPKGSGADDKNISIHGPVQINHGINIWKEGNIYSEQIMSPFRNPGENDSAEKSASTLGRQSKLQEGHYVHHFSINPKNIEEMVKIAEDNSLLLTEGDINLLKEGLRKGATYYDSAAKSGTENEILFYVELKEDSKLVLPNFTEMVKVKEGENNNRVFDLELVRKELNKYKDDIERCEIYYNPNLVDIEKLPDGCRKLDIVSGKEIEN